jgi:chromosomal replication initiator protein
MTQDSLSLGLDPRNTFDSYIVGTANRLAAAAAKRVAESPGAAYNPLFLYAESGLGKTHLIMAIGNHIRRVHGDIEVVYDTLEHLMEGVMEAIQAGERDAFRARLRGTHPYCCSMTCSSSQAGAARRRNCCVRGIR